MGIAAIGFNILDLSIRENRLNWNFRAMVCYEKIPNAERTVLVSGMVVLGSVASLLFIPMLEMVYSAYQQVPPFKITAEYTDYVKVLGITGTMLVTGLTILYWLVRKINVHQVIKMGEDS